MAAAAAAGGDAGLQRAADAAWPWAYEFVDSPLWADRVQVGDATVWRRAPSAGKEGLARPIKV
eukprot:SAG22_NODE_3170_length_1882_cov_1.579361_1_plen_62_part_10